MKCKNVKEAKDASQFKTCAICGKKGRQNHMNSRERANEEGNFPAKKTGTRQGVLTSIATESFLTMNYLYFISFG